MKTMMDYEMYKRGVDVKDFNDKLLQKVLYGSDIGINGTDISIVVKGGN